VNQALDFFFVGVELDLAAALLAGDFLAAALAFAGAVSPVTAFFAAPRLEGAVVFFVVAAFFAGAFFVEAALGLAAAGLVAAVLAEAGLAGAGFAALDFVVEVVRVVPVALDAVFFAPLALALALVAVVRGFGAAFFTLVDLVVVALVVFGLAATLGLTAGLFSLAAEVSLFPPFGESFTRPEGPFGRTNSPFSAPLAMALLS